MTRNVYKLLFLQQYVQFQLMLQNNYHDEAKSIHKKMHEMLESFYEQKKVGKFYYKKMKRELKKYDVMYAGLEIRKRQKGWNHRTRLIGKDHFE